MFMLYDPWVLLIGVVAMVFSGMAAVLVKKRFHQAREVPLSTNLSGAEVAARILRHNDIRDVQVVEHQGFLSDHYNPMSKTLALSPQVYNGRNAAAAGIAAHEVGHAIQHANAYLPLKMRSILVPVANLGSNLGMWLAMIGIALGTFAADPSGQVAAGSGAYYMLLAGIVLFAGATAFTLITLPVEFDASSRAKVLLREIGITRSEEEYSAVRKVLGAAALTYVAAAITSILYLLYFLWRAGLLGNRR